MSSAPSTRQPTPRRRRSCSTSGSSAAHSSVLVPFVRVAQTLAEHREGIVNAIALGLSNARLEAMNSTVRLISHRSRGFRHLESLLAMIRLVCGKIPVTLPT
ncbi:MAG: transposase [Thermoleophilaceae bacterium]